MTTNDETLDRALDLLATEYVISKSAGARKAIANVVEELIGGMPQRGRREIPSAVDEALRQRAEIKRQRVIASFDLADRKEA